MRFLKTLLLIVVAVLLTMFSYANWHDVTINLWGDIQADIKLPVLLALAFAIGFLPPFLILRTRLWALRRKLGVHERAAAIESAETVEADEETPVI